MKVKVFILIVLSFVAIQCDKSHNQTSQVRTLKLPSNSFKGQLDNKIKYTYVDNAQSHDYSGNWDFDGDGVRDRLQFVGNGGAHLMFSPQIHLSYNDTITYLNYILLDRPFLYDINSLNASKNESNIQFVVSDFNNDGVSDIYLDINDGHNYIPSQIQKLGVKTTKIILSYNKQKEIFTIDDYIAPNN